MTLTLNTHFQSVSINFRSMATIVSEIFIVFDFSYRKVKLQNLSLP